MAFTVALLPFQNFYLYVGFSGSLLHFFHLLHHYFFYSFFFFEFWGNVNLSYKLPVSVVSTL